MGTVIFGKGDSFSVKRSARPSNHPDSFVYTIRVGTEIVELSQSEVEILALLFLESTHDCQGKKMSELSLIECGKRQGHEEIFKHLVPFVYLKGYVPVINYVDIYNLYKEFTGKSFADFYR